MGYARMSGPKVYGFSAILVINIVLILVMNRPWVLCSGRGRGYSLIWPICGQAAGQGMVFGPTLLNTVGNFTCFCLKEGQNLSYNRVWLRDLSLFSL